MSYSCGFFDDLAQESLSSAKVVVPLVVDLLHPASIVDVGCATGAWLSVFRDHEIKTVLGLDGAYVDPSKLLIPHDCFRVVDLAKSFCLSEKFDLAISLEVAEHLPASNANSFVRSLCQLAPLVLFSAAVPGQCGVHHVNEQWPEYWRELFSGFSFRMFDPFRPLVMHDERVAVHYRQNLFLFIRDDVLRVRPELHRLPEVEDANGLMLVAGFVLFGNLGLRATLNRLPNLLLKSILKRLANPVSKRSFSAEASPKDKMISW